MLELKSQAIPNVLVLLAAYNGEKWIEQQIESILAQKFVQVTLLLSVDLSTDATYEKCRSIAQKYCNIHLLDYGERFGGAAQNFFRLIRETNFDSYQYVALADQDDIWLESKLAHAIDIIVQENVDAFSSDVIAFWESDKQQLVKKSYPQKKYDYIFEAAGPGCTYVFLQESLLIFKDFLLKNKRLTKDLALHDWAIYAFFRSHGMRWWIDDKPLMLYRQHAQNQVGYNHGLKAFVKRLSLIKSGWYRNQILLVLKVINLSGNVDLTLTRSFLILNFYQLRRRIRDAIVLLIMAILGFV